MMNALAEFFSPEAGQARRQWLNNQEQRVGNALSYYLGPAADPIQSAAILGGYMMPGADMMDASQASQEMFRAQTPMDAATAGAAMLGATGMMFLPGNLNALQEGFGQAVDGMTAAYDPAMVRSGMGPASETAAQEVARLLREGRAADVTDDMMARVDPQEMWRLYEVGATGAEMPMDLASRMARAQEMGLTQGAYHGTGTGDISAFRVSELGPSGQGVYVSIGPEIANRYADDGAVYPLSVDTSNMATAAQEAAAKSDVRAQGVRGYGPESAAMTDILSGEGFTGVNDGVTSVVFDPRNIRSQFARFDPRLAHLGNLSAGIGGVAIGMNALAAPTQENAERQQILDWLATQ